MATPTEEDYKKALELLCYVQGEYVDYRIAQALADEREACVNELHKKVMQLDLTEHIKFLVVGALHLAADEPPPSEGGKV